MKNLIILFIILLKIQIGYSQNTYFKVLTTPISENGGETIETENGDIILYAQEGSFLNINYIKFYKIDQAGDTIASKVLKKEEDFYSFTRILKLNNEEFVAVGSSFNFAPNPFFSFQNKIIFYTFNSDLDSISFTEISVNSDAMQYISVRDAILNTNNHIITLCEEMNQKIVILLETSISGDSIRSSNLIPEPGFGIYIYSIEQKPNNNGYYITTDGDYNHLGHGYTSHIITTDTNLIYESIDSLAGECAYFSQIRKFNNNLVVGGRAKRTWIPAPPANPYPTEEYCIEKLDTDFKVIKQIFLSHVVLNYNSSSDDTISYPSLGRNFDYIDTNNIYTCHYREFPWVIYPNTPNYFVVAKFNSNLEIKWQYYFGNDAFYSPNSILATQDGGVFVSGNRYDAKTQSQEFDIFYLKLDSTGIFVSNTEHQIPMHSINIYPNPGSNQMYIESGPQVMGSKFILFDVNGIKVKEDNITSYSQAIQVDTLRAGQYIWKVMKQGKIIDSGKWIKI